MNFSEIRDNPIIYNLLLFFFRSFYIIALVSCINIIYDGIILGYITKIKSILGNFKSYVLKMVGSGGSPPQINQTPSFNEGSPPPVKPTTNTVDNRYKKSKKKVR
jgi:hypothetical protein